jgi:hypothetical protein
MFQDILKAMASGENNSIIPFIPNNTACKDSASTFNPTDTGEFTSLCKVAVSLE